jgi:hypothetical protein
MKYIIYTVYIATVLLFSGFARAQTVTIDEVYVDHQTLDLEVSGYVPTPCHQLPTAVLTFDHLNPRTLVVRLVSPSHGDYCIQRLKNYSTIVPLRQLARASRLPLEASVLYVVKTEGHDFSIAVSGQDLIEN